MDEVNVKSEGVSRMSNSNKPISIILSDDLIEGIECFRFEHHLTTRAKAIRCLLEDALNDDNVLKTEVEESIVDKIKENSFREGQDDGYIKGFNDGYKHGYEKGLNEGIDKGYDDGYARANKDNAELERNKERYARLKKNLDEVDKKAPKLQGKIKITKERTIEYFKKHNFNAGFSEEDSVLLAEHMYQKIWDDV